jgi:hypothetical protein
MVMMGDESQGRRETSVVSDVGGDQASEGGQRVVGYNRSAFLSFAMFRLSIVSKGLAYATRVAAQNFAIWRRAINISARRGQTVAHKRERHGD